MGPIFRKTPKNTVISQPLQMLGVGRFAGALCHLQLLSVSLLNISCTKCLTTDVLVGTAAHQRAFTPEEEEGKAVWCSAISPLRETRID